MGDWQSRQWAKLTPHGEKQFEADEKGGFPIIHMDDDFCSMLGYDRQELTMLCHARMSELVYSEDYEQFREEMLRGLEQDGTYTVRYRMRHRSGEMLWIWESGEWERNLLGKRTVRSLAVDTSQATSFRQDRDIIYENIPGGVLKILISSSNFYVIDANERGLRMFQTTREEYVGSSGMFTILEDREGLKNHIIQRAKNGANIDYEFRSQQGVEGVRWFQLLGQKYDETEDGCEYLCILIDITARHKTMLDLEREKQRNQILVGISASFWFDYNYPEKKLNIQGGSKRGRFIPCVPKGDMDIMELLRKDNFLHPLDIPKAEKMLQESDRVQADLRFKSINRNTREISYQWFEVEVGKSWRDGKPLRLLGNMRHIEEREWEEKRRYDLNRILQLQADKLYEMLLCIQTETGELNGYFTEEKPFHEEFPQASYDDFMRMAAEEYVHPEDRELYESAMNLPHMIEILKYSKNEEMLFVRTRKRGEEYRYKCIRYSYLGDRTDYILITTQDMHKLHERQIMAEDANRKILAHALKEEQTTMEVRQNFSRMIARELRSPLKVVRQILRQESWTEEEKKKTHRALSYINRVIDNVTTYDSVDKGEVRIERKKFALDEMLWEVFNSWQDRLKGSKMELEYHLDLKWSEYYGDVGKIAQIMDNLISNCLIATGGGGKVIAWGRDIDQGDGESCLVLTLEDTGVMIEEGFLGRHFQLSSLEEQTAWDIGEEYLGTSFSLIVARKLVEILGGDMKLSRKGTDINEIEIRIPLLKSRNHLAGAGHSGSAFQWSGPDFSDYSILVVENTRQREKLTAPMLQLNGARVDIAYSGGEALALWSGYREGTFDLILLVGNPADMDYLEFAEALRRQERPGEDVPIFVSIEGGGQDTVQEGMKVGINAFLSVPLELRRLKILLDMYKKAV